MQAAGVASHILGNLTGCWLLMMPVNTLASDAHAGRFHV